MHRQTYLVGRLVADAVQAAHHDLIIHVPPYLLPSSIRAISTGHAVPHAQTDSVGDLLECLVAPYTTSEAGT
eukprot:1437867-Rhodomonas_salina.3